MGEEVTRANPKRFYTATVGWDACSLRYLLARKMTYNNDGSLSFPNDAVRQLTKRIQALQAQVANGTFVPDREDDVLSQAQGTKEHPGQAQGVGLVPWQIAFENDKSTYRSRGRIMLEKLRVYVKNCQLCSRPNGKKRR